MAQHFQVAVNMQSALQIASPGHLFSERAGTETDGPDHRAGLDALTVGEGHAASIDRHDRRVDDPLDAQCFGRFDNGRANAIAQGRSDLWRAIYHDYLDLGVVAQCRAQAGRHFSRGFDPGKTTAGDYHGVARSTRRQVLQRLDVGFQTVGFFNLIDIESVFDHALQRWTDNATAGSQHQAIVAQCALRTEGVAIDDLLVLGVDRVRNAFDEFHPDRLEQLAQRRRHGVHVRLVETRTDAQFRLGGKNADLHVVTSMLVQQAGGAQGAPDSTKPCANNQNVLFHRITPEEKINRLWGLSVRAGPSCGPVRCPGSNQPSPCAWRFD
ncbi:hypothetical protein D3C76_980390 [compost metagenome]